MKYSKLFVSLLITLLTAFIGSLATNPNIKNGWYATLHRSMLTPPNWVFPIVWTTLFILMGIAFYLVWLKPRHPKFRLATLLFALQLILNVAWSVLFFYFQNPLWSLLEIIPLWLSILFTLLVFKKINKTAGWLFLPYLLWVSFATYLNLVIVIG